MNVAPHSPFTAKAGSFRSRPTRTESRRRAACSATQRGNTVAQIDGLPRNVSPYFLPMPALGTFAGIRHSEILRMTWEHFRWPQRAIAVPAVVARKVRIGRTVPMLDALVAWLVPYAERTGRIYPEKETNIKGKHDRELFRLAKLLGFPWIELRQLPARRGQEQVALEMGNSPAKIRTNYHDPKSEAEATAYFGLQPVAQATSSNPFAE